MAGKSLAVSEAEQTAWRSMFALREPALAELEKARQAKLIGKSLEAKLKFTTRDGAVFSAHQDSLREILNVSRLELTTDANAAASIFEVTKADGQKCERCWHWETDIGQDAEHPALCPRCVVAVRQAKP